ncbi:MULTISPECIES: acyl-CoA dehydrogenase family protein [unclassified Pseudofrankia]|uniref:acyl-CoA dehydrogenase family protein n=1 Tax=unclassified Pseudofrankia TaxID=2994372 RepID=UPI0008D99CAD|nr:MULTISPECIES: acyl-CoA dehydrogenase family protein [unclassified Pseudofrankia]MDT3441954.1 acyl-CoA dehydrogenase family protein [Pseudofrankia sp. BMG5.37]OHV44637.1 acyl-CoA dehydrogenase [Pseudofrankia sp. BMG5.36]
MQRRHFEVEHEAFRDLCRSFFVKECAPRVEEWERAGQVDRDVWRRAGAAGMLLWEAPEEFGGQGVRDYRYSQVLAEEIYATGSAGLGFGLQNDVMPPYLIDLTNQDQKARWLPGSVTGDTIWGLAISEPGAGSDVASIRATALRDGDVYVVNGTKAFITNGLLLDKAVVAVKTDPAQRHKGVSLLVVEDGMPGFERGRHLDKVGQRSQDTAELFFRDVRVPVTNLLGEEGRGFGYLMRNLPQERLGAGVAATGVMWRALGLTVDYVRSRQAFGQTLGGFQNTRFELAEVKTLCEVAQAYVDKAVVEHLAGDLSPEDAAGLKQWTTDTQNQVVDRCLQLFGGYGYMNEYEIARLWRDSRVQRIYAGSNEVMKEIVGRALRLEGPAA